MATTKKTTVKKTATKKVTKKAATKKVAAKKTATKKAAKPAAKKAATKKAAKPATKKAATKKVATKKAATKKVATKKAATKKAVTKKVTTKKAATKKAATKKATTKKAVTKKATAKKPAVRKERLPRGYKITKIVKELNLPEGIGGKDHYELYEVTGPNMDKARYFISDEAAREYIGKSEKLAIEAKALSGKGHAPVGMREVVKVTSDMAAAAELEEAGTGPKSDRKEAKVMYSDSE